MARGLPGAAACAVGTLEAVAETAIRDVRFPLGTREGQGWGQKSSAFWGDNRLRGLWPVLEGGSWALRAPTPSPVV